MVGRLEAGGRVAAAALLALGSLAPLEGPLLTEPDQVYTINFAGASKGDYKFYCLPHLALGMKGKLSVQ